MVHRRRTQTVSVSLLYSTIFYPYSFCWVGGWNVEYANLLFVDRTFVAAFAKLTSCRDVGSSFSSIAPTD